MEGKRKAGNDGRGGNGEVGNDILVVQLPARGRTRSYPPPFLMKTFEMVEDPETNCIISWSPTHTSFIIWDQIRFTTELLHKYFRHNNFSSFVYQLNNYGFKKVSWEKYEYENQWFQAGKRHLLKNIKRRNQQYDYDMSQQQASYGSSDNLVKDGMEEQLETLMTEQHGLKVEIQKLNQQQKDMKYRLNTLEESMKVAEREKGDMMSQLLVQHFIKNLREKREMSRNEIIKKQKLDEFGRKKMSVELAGEGDDSRLNVDKDQVQEELIIVQPEGKAISSADNSGGSDQDQQATAASEYAENCAFWKQIMEDESQHQNGREDQEKNHPKVIVKLEDLIGSNTVMEGENLIERPLDRNVEEGNDIKSCT